MTPKWMPPLPEPCVYMAYTLIEGALGYHSPNQMQDYALAAVEAYKAGLKPVAWGAPNSRITEQQPFLSLLHQLPVDGGIDGRRKQPLYPEMLVPLYRLD